MDHDSCLAYPQPSAPNAISGIKKKVMDVEVSGDPPSLYRLPKGCRYSDRCKYAFDLCRQKAPELAAVAGGREVACFLHHKVAKGELSVLDQKTDA